MKYLLLLFTVLFITSSCEQMQSCGSTKEAYLQKLEDLVDRAKSEAESKNPAWESLDRQYEFLYENCADEWDAELSIADKAKVAGMVLQYQYYRVGSKKLNELFQ
jgi:hypothetical protein